MKKRLLLKLAIGLPLILLADYLLMAVLGCATCLLGFGDTWYCGPYCLIGKLILVLSMFFSGWFIYSEVRRSKRTAQV
jgi:hypothetical protein